MIIHICDCCGKEIKNKQIICCSIPIEQYTEARNSMGQIIGKYKMNTYLTKDIELCPFCAEKMATFYQKIKTSSKVLTFRDNQFSYILTDEGEIK